jgi:SulP family sulfate permease
MLITMGVARMGKLIQFIPYPVTTGFAAGSAVVIVSLQFKDFFGLQLAAQPDHFLDRIWRVGQALPGFHPPRSADWRSDSGRAAPVAAPENQPARAADRH